jgi:hypothetical protein
MPHEQRQQWTDNLRRIPLAAILRAMDAQPDARDHSKWRTSRGVLSVNGAKFINWNNSQGGGGAIDLAMHLNNLNFKDAVRWLDRQFHTSNPSPTTPPANPSQKLILPTPDNHHLDRVRNYLIKQRRLPETLVEPLVQTGEIYADRLANAVFPLLGKDNTPVGAELRGTRTQQWRGLAPGSRKNRGYFAAGTVCKHQAILCESAIDAISCAAIHPDHLCISTSGARPNPAWLPPLLAQGWRIQCGFDADSTGDRIAQTMIATHHTIQRLRPPLHDWNDTLIAIT